MKLPIHSLCWLVALPACAGIAAGMWLTPAKPSVRSGTAESSPAPREEDTAALPDDPEILQLAAMAGRTQEARVKIAELLASGASNDEIAVWLAPVLLSNPAWLDSFIQTVPGDQHTGLMRATFRELGKLHPDAMWELIRASPFAADAAKSILKKSTDPFDVFTSIISRFPDSPLATEVLFDPTNGFSDDEIARGLESGIHHPESARRILDEWIAGRWADNPPGCVRAAWHLLGQHDGELLNEIRGKLPEGFQEAVKRFEILDHTGNFKEPAYEPDAAELSLLDVDELIKLIENRASSGRPIPLATLKGLPAGAHREYFLNGYFSSFYPFQADQVRPMIEELDRHGLSDVEEGLLLRSAAYQETVHHGDYETALEWAGRITNSAERNGFGKFLMREWAQYDPHGALDYASRLPPGDARDFIEQTAHEAMP